MEEQRRGKTVAVAGSILQAIFAAVVLVIWLWTDSLSALTSTLTLAGGVLLWLMVAVLFYCRQLAARESLELEDLAARGGQGGSIFEQAEGTQSRPAAHRAAVVERWAVPIFTLVWAGYHATMGILLLSYVGELERAPKLANAGAGALFLLLVLFAAFLFSRYTTGMGRVSAWRPLRSTGSYLLVNVVFVLGACVSLAAAWQGYGEVDRVVAYVVPALQLVLAVELGLNFVLDLYRPRVPGEEDRLSFDSRLLNLLAEPGRIGHSIAETLNYQFGFEVSKTWFYQLLSRAFVPLLFFGVLLLFAMSCMVIVREGQQAVVLHWGRADPHRGTLGPGLHWKWPWPVDTARRFDVRRIHQLFLGAGEERTEAERADMIVKGRELYLWTKEHGRREELNFLVGVPSRTRRTKALGEAETPPVNIIKLVVQVKYRIKDVYQYGYAYTDAQKMLACVANREMVRYCASATLYEAAGTGEADRPEAIMTFGRERAARKLRELIQDEADKLRLGVEIVYAGLLAAHPPADAAGAFEEVLEAERRQLETRYKAEGEANEVLANVAGRATAALQLAVRIRVLEDLEILRDSADSPAEFRKNIELALRAIRKDREDLAKEIKRARLLGKYGAGELGKSARSLKEAYDGHLATLLRIREAPETFNFAGAIEVARKAADNKFHGGKGAGTDDEPVTGEAEIQVAQAESTRWETELAERARFEAIQRERLVWRANPHVYQWDRWLDVLDEVLADRTKYVLGVDKDLIEVWLNLERQQAAMAGVTFEQPEEGSK